MLFQAYVYDLLRLQQECENGGWVNMSKCGKNSSFWFRWMVDENQTTAHDIVFDLKLDLPF
jgi:hypothetical protein